MCAPLGRERIGAGHLAAVLCQHDEVVGGEPLQRGINSVDPGPGGNLRACGRLPFHGEAAQDGAVQLAQRRCQDLLSCLQWQQAVQLIYGGCNIHQGTPLSEQGTGPAVWPARSGRSLSRCRNRGSATPAGVHRAQPLQQHYLIC
jgi:hypothetical protein